MLVIDGAAKVPSAKEAGLEAVKAVNVPAAAEEPPMTVPLMVPPLMVLLVRVSAPASVAKSPSVSAVLNWAVVPVTVLDPRANVLFERTCTSACIPSASCEREMRLVSLAVASKITRSSLLALPAPERAVRSVIRLPGMGVSSCECSEAPKGLAVIRQGRNRRSRRCALQSSRCCRSCR